ncbi:hypothetical protein FF1_032896 [Malus domestica]
MSIVFTVLLLFHIFCILVSRDIVSDFICFLRYIDEYFGHCIYLVLTRNPGNPLHDSELLNWLISDASIFIVSGDQLSWTRIVNNLFPI